MSFQYPVQMRFSDIDAYGHVNNAVFFTYLETARTNFFLQSFRHFLDQGLLFLVAHAECTYRKPIPLCESVNIDMDIAHIGRSSFTITYRIHDGTSLYAEAKTTMVCLEKQSGKPVSIPEELRTLLTEHLTAPA
ncbi:thioesterase superfamily protein [Desulfurispirillum indicum S5]|uniref:Thioesterase superfamily protein n=1 Tax=Desulfurispirillum indicum (strain ATCC BAA-1389 / DSM 22839 / S5) TaxID=653733 RepID=E6W6A1_DESIS|nr:thioesterase family protein [Desulfurispirillum indicum]ADU66137.1 thioesterase superfamily protein [Desulfurispirillum indicum S5]